MPALISTLTMLLLGGSPVANSAVARVNGEEISAAHFRAELARRFEALALDDLIMDKLLEQEARRLKIKVDAKEIQRSASTRGGKAAIAAARRNWLMDEISRRATVVAEEEIRFVYESNKPYFVMSAQYRLRDLVLGAKDNADQLYELLRTGGDFAQLAKTFSIDLASRARGGDLGWLPLKSLTPALREVASTMKPGEISKPIRLDDEWHLLKLEGYNPERQKPLNEVKADIHRRLFQERQPIVRYHLLDELRRKAKIQTHVRHSEPEPQR